MSQMTEVRGVHTSKVTRPDGSLSVVYRGTEVVSVDDMGVITLRSNGWQTATTKTRMNQTAYEFGLPYNVWQKNYEWFVTFDVDVYGFQVVIPFRDGMTLEPGRDPR